MTQIDFPRQLNAIFLETLLEMDVEISYETNRQQFSTVLKLLCGILLQEHKDDVKMSKLSSKS